MTNQVKMSRKSSESDSIGDSGDEEEQPEEYCVGGYHPVHVVHYTKVTLLKGRQFPRW